MSSSVHIAFNLLVNAVGSFLFALALVYAVLAGFRVGQSRDRLLLLMLPLAKTFWDLGHGIPRDSFFWEKLQGARQDLGSFMVGVGFSPTGPLLQAKLGARWGTREYPQSIAELFDSLLSRKLDVRAPAVLVAACLTVSLLRLGWRAGRWVHFGRQARRWRASVPPIEIRQVGRRKVAIYAPRLYTGAPFAAGTMRPYVMLSPRTLATLSPSAREAVIQHELSHIAHADPALHTLLLLVSDLFWFLPGLSGLVRRFRAVFELRADEGAVRAGADRTALALALVTVGEGLIAGQHHSLSLARDRPLLTLRVQRLLDSETQVSSPRWGYGHGFGKAAILGLVVISILQAVFFGNYG